jgi:hypothetical protein
MSFERQLISGELLDANTFLARTGWAASVLSETALPHGLFRIEVGGAQAYPAFYADRRFDLRTLESVSRLLGDVSSGAKWLFFTQPKGSLAIPAAPGQTNGTARTPLQAIEAGDVDLVKRAAVSFSER